MNKKVVFLAGPTAVGKTKYAIALAKAIDGEIISADSMQIYKYLDIGSAKPTQEELSEATHYLVDEIDPREGFSVAQYQSVAKAHIHHVLEKGKVPIVSGGTGLYLNALLFELNFSVMPKQDDLRKNLEAEALAHGVEHVHNKLQALDPHAAARIHPNNLKKVIRAIEVVTTSGEGIGDFQNSFVKTADYNSILICLTRDREELYGRIDARVDQLFQADLVREVQSLLDMGLSAENISMKGIGYKEVIGFLTEEYPLEEAIRLVKRNTRHYAKRQLTWFRRYEDAMWLNLSECKTQQAAVEAMVQYVKSKE